MTHPAAGGRSSSAVKQEILARVPFIDEASAELRQALAEMAVVVRLRAGEYFLREGDSCAHFAVVATGKMRVFKQGENGHEITLYNVCAGDICPLNVSCILSDTLVPATAQVEEDVEAVVVPAATFRRWIAQHESLRAFVFRMFAGRMTEVMSLVEEVAFRRMDQRLARRLAELFGEGGAESIETTHAELAADLGTAREVVSRLLKDFERLGAVRLSRGRILAQNAAVLGALAARESN